MELTKPQITELINILQGTCSNLNDAIEGTFGILFSDIDIRSLEAIDEEIFECTQCGLVVRSIGKT